MKKVLSILAICSLTIFGATAAVAPGDDFNANTAIAAESLQRWYNSHGLWDTTGWWNAANCVDAIENVIVANNGQKFLDVPGNTFALNSNSNFLNEYYDDEGWWALAWIRAYDLTGENRYLDAAKIIFDDMKSSWGGRCGGGIWWKKDHRYKNAIANELFLLVGIRLHQRTPGDDGAGSYLDWAVREWDWFENSGMINSQNLINDGLTRNCENNGRTTWTYNQGVVLGGLTELYKSTGDTNYLNHAIAIADAATAKLIYTNGILREPCEPNGCGGADVPQFKGIFIRYLADLYDVTRKPAYHDFLFANAHSVWFNDRDQLNRFGFRWTGPVDTPDAARHSSAMTPISALAEPVTTNLLFAKGSGNPAFNHDIGAASGTLAWTCDPAHTARAGFMQSGPFLESLPTGTHVVHFQMAVNALSGSKSNLVRLDVRENNGGTILASREIAWNEFREINRPQDFALTFKNATAGNPLEFRVYWNNVSGAPALTISDVTIGNDCAWTAANLEHEIGQLDGVNNWCADSVRNKISGYLVKGLEIDEPENARLRAVFELRVDNFNWDNSKIATISVVEKDNGEIAASRDIKRGEFRNTLYRPFDLDFRAKAGKRYELRTFRYFAPHAPRLTQRSVILERN